MPQPLLGEIRIFGGSFMPLGWMFCDGRLLPIAEYDALFTLIGTTYGGDGETSFALPNLQSRTPVHQIPPTYVMGQMGGVESVTVTQQQMPAHTHAWLAADAPATALAPAGSMPAEATKRFYLSATPATAMAAGSVGAAGAGQPHENMQPYLVLNYIIAVFGEFPQAT